MIRKSICIILSIWGWVCLGIMFYYTSLFFVRAHDPYRHEYWQGVAFGWLFGVITWIALPAVSIFWHKNLPRLFLLLTNIPSAIALIYLFAYLVSLFAAPR